MMEQEPMLGVKSLDSEYKPGSALLVRFEVCFYRLGAHIFFCPTFLACNFCICDCPLLLLKPLSLMS